MSDDVWGLHGIAGELLGELVQTGSDSPWLHGTLTATPAFDTVRPLFDDDLRLLDRIDEDPESWDAARLRITEAVALTTPDGNRVAEFLLHVSETDAWWR